MMFGQLAVYPPGVKFASQNHDERIFILIRQHVMTNIGWLFRTALLILLPLIIWLVIDFLIISFPVIFPQGADIRSFLPDTIWIVLALIYYTTVFTYAFAKFLDWYFDVYLVTSERIIHTEFRIMTGKFISEAPLRNIQDVSQSIVGFFPSLFNYGDVVVQTAAEKGKFYFRSVPDPNWFRDVVTDLAKVISRT